jgi:hypothetical protein
MAVPRQEDVFPVSGRRWFLVPVVEVVLAKGWSSLLRNDIFFPLASEQHHKLLCSKISEFRESYPK